MNVDKELWDDMVRALDCALWYYQSFRDSSPLGPTELQDITAFRETLAKAGRVRDDS